MEHKNQAQIKRKKIQLTVLILLLAVLLVANFFVYSGLSLKKFALAVSGNYSKSTGQQLTIGDWNNLPNDFVDKSGDTMRGALNMGSQRITNLANPTAGTDAVNQTAMNTAIGAAVAGSASIKDYSSNAALRMVCGRTTSLDWVPMGGYTRVDIDFSAAGFAAGSNPFVLTSMGGAGNHYLTRGATSIYPNYGGLPANRGFSIYIMNDTGIPYPFTTYNWYINWCATGN